MATTRGVYTEDNPRPCKGAAEHPPTSGLPVPGPTRVTVWPSAAPRLSARRGFWEAAEQHRLDDLACATQGQRTEAGMLSIVRRGHTYQVRYASYDPYALDRAPYRCADEETLVAWLCQSGLDDWALQQAVTAVRKGGSAVLPVAFTMAQINADFPLPQEPCRRWDADDEVRQADTPRRALRR